MSGLWCHLSVHGTPLPHPVHHCHVGEPKNLCLYHACGVISLSLALHFFIVYTDVMSMSWAGLCLNACGVMCLSLALHFLILYVVMLVNQAGLCLNVCLACGVICLSLSLHGLYFTLLIWMSVSHLACGVACRSLPPLFLCLDAPSVSRVSFCLALKVCVCLIMHVLLSICPWYSTSPSCMLMSCQWVELAYT